MGTYQITCEECGSTFEAVVYPSQRARRFCNKNCAQSFRNRLRAVADRVDVIFPEPVVGARWIALSKGLFALVDEADFASLSQWNWSASRTGGTGKKSWYAQRGRTPSETIKSGKTAPILMHRYLLGDPVEDIDHKNRNGLDNRRENLRLVNSSQNGMNSIHKGGSSRFKGVSRYGKKWNASIKVNYETTRLGRFDTEEKAARAYDEAARRLHGEFARVNFPIGDERSALHDD